MPLPRNITRFKIHYYGGECLLVLNRKHFETAYKWLNDDSHETNEEHAGLTCQPVTKDGQVYYLIGIFDRQADTLIHEVCHLSVFILDRANVDPRKENGESLAYLLSHFFQEFSKKVFEQPKKKKQPINQGEPQCQTVLEEKLK